jgi:RNA-splicing ligase RtcB
MTIKDNVVPNLVGVDIGCCMLVAKLKDRSVDFDKLDKAIRERIPSGKSHRESKHSMAKDFPIEDMIVYKEGKMEYTELLSIGSLGGGNHFIELDKDSHGNLYVVIHSGSRHLGLATCDYWQGIAIDECNDLTQQRGAIIAKYKSEGREDELPAALASIPHFPPPKELSYLTGKSFDGYLHDMALAQEFATRNREAMLEEIVRALRLHVVDKFCTLHNYIDLKHMILRKGSVSAQEGERLIVPLNMRDGSLICTGKGNADWNFSAPHGAGRKMSRSKAKESISLEAYQKAMRGIYTTCVNKSTLDESPMAYKPSKEIIENIKDSCDVVDTIKPVYNFKASD